MVGGEDLGPRAPSLRVDLAQNDVLDLVRADVELPAGDPAPRYPFAAERERVTEGRERLNPFGRILRPHQGVPRGEQALPVVGPAGGMVDDLAAVRDMGSDRVDVSGNDRGVDTGVVRGRGVRLQPAVGPRCGLRCDGRRSGRQLLEAGERLGVALGVELLRASHEAIDSEDPEVAKASLERATAGAVRAEV